MDELGLFTVALGLSGPWRVTRTEFYDIGTGRPTASNTHEVAQAIVPECRIVYVDNDPLIMAHARALLTSTPEGATDYVYADLRDPDTILQEAARTLDFTQPIALMLLGIMEHIVDTGEAYAIVNRLLEALPSGSYLALCDPTTEVRPEVMQEAVRQWNNSATPGDQSPQPPGADSFLRRSGIAGARGSLGFTVATHKHNPHSGRKTLASAACSCRDGSMSLRAAGIRPPHAAWPLGPQRPSPRDCLSQ